MEKKYKVKDEYLLKEVAGEYIVVPVGKEAVSFHGVINLNETGKFLFENLTKPISILELVSKLTEEYDVNEEQAIKDVKLFVETLIKNNVLE